MKYIAVFCASSDGLNPIHKEVAYQLGAAIANKGWGLVYGGASVGSMGAVAKGCLDHNGKVIGIIPHFLARKEIAQEGVHEMIYVESMHERKLKMNELSDASITLAGGFGTLEEFFEIVTWGQLGLHRKANGLLNVSGYYDHLIAQLKVMIEEGLLKRECLDLLVIEEKVDAVLEKVSSYEPPTIEPFLKKEET